LISGTDRIPAMTDCAKITEVRVGDNSGPVPRLPQMQCTCLSLRASRKDGNRTPCQFLWQLRRPIKFDCTLSAEQVGNGYHADESVQGRGDYASVAPSWNGSLGRSAGLCARSMIGTNRSGSSLFIT
jgi:hypothetical protein